MTNAVLRSGVEVKLTDYREMKTELHHDASTPYRQGVTKSNLPVRMVGSCARGSVFLLVEAQCQRVFLSNR
jgi:hypothetical protein